ncbi:MAG: peptidase, partial [Psychroserpens sp.]|nr:peptidase [Psychroserpens sp.]
CASNPINNQNPGNWTPDRAGWCPGMVVPPRIDQFTSIMAGSTFTFEYDYEDWVSDLAGG